MQEFHTTAGIPEGSLLRPIGDLTIVEAEQFYADLLAFHRQEGLLQIDLGAVSAMDSSCVQLMVPATRSGRVTVQGCSSRSRDAFEEIGFSQLLPKQES